MSTDKISSVEDNDLPFSRIAILSMPTEDNKRESTAYFNPVILNRQGLQHSYEYSSERTDVMAKKYRPYQIVVEAQDHNGNKFRKILFESLWHIKVFLFVQNYKNNREIYACSHN